MGAATPSASLLLLSLRTLLLLGWGCSAQDFVFDPDWGFTSYEVIIPRQLVTRGGGRQEAGRTTYLLRFGGKRNIVHLRPKKLLLSRNLRVFTFTEDGVQVEDQPYVPTDCNFQGSVEGSPQSQAMLSTCLGGLRGMLRIEDSFYQIEPIQASFSFEHVVYRLKEDPVSNFTCGLTDQEIERQLSKLKNLTSPRAHSWTSTYVHQKYMELMIILDKLRFLFLNSNLTKAISDTIVMTGVMDTYFQVLNARIQLTAIEVWTDVSKVNTSVKKLTQVLDQIAHYRNNILYHRIRTDWTHLYVHKYYPDALGWAFVGTVCERKFGVSTSTLPNRNLVAPATWSAHELGHGVGMPHDKRGCYCQGKTDCIMGTGGRFGFSNCSFIHYFNLVTGKGVCLDNVPGFQYTLKKCGNKVVDSGEECDCGTIEECKKDMCCQPDCKLKPGAQCNIGLCCTNCQFSPSGRVCRSKQNDCDLVEFCNGTSNLCPNDFYKQDGTPCSNEAHCYRKGCYDRYLQCKEIFGTGAMDAPYVCYHEVHRRADRFGNCGFIGRGYRKCKMNDILCGRLQCVNVKNVPEMPDHTTVVFTHVKEFNIRCWGTDYHPSMVAMALPDDGVIKDGTSCGTDSICINKICRNISVLRYDCDPEKCNKRGVCNNRKHCHCNYGWAPPFCETPGYGGSIDSGPAGKVEIVSKPVKVVPIMFIRLILLVVSLVLVILKEVIGKFLKRKVKVVVHLAKKPLAKNKGEKRGEKVPKKHPKPPK
ncbi:disintegrin and metalloproteinase domain-containing protein 30-like [Dromiciops gliroides]|uniref:disintegrin and metalloproteinase domain-containing protein 30-like n=1 Tax=Dromiciops gliroides TaxID=33562 RepID=UPI001CC3D038|nr:disintegrin and metalloproteinase domain-containing protein 30-like [Dromiciops gliroides]